MNKQIETRSIEINEETLIKSFVNFCLKHCPKNLALDELFFFKWCSDHVKDGRFAADVEIQNGELTVRSLGMFRFVDDVDKTEDEFYHNENGEILWIDLWIDELGESTKSIIKTVLMRLNKFQKFFAFVRGFDGDFENVSVYPIEKIWRFA